MILEEFQDIFAVDPSELGCTKLVNILLILAFCFAEQDRGDDCKNVRSMGSLRVLTVHGKPHCPSC